MQVLCKKGINNPFFKKGAIPFLFLILISYLVFADYGYDNPYLPALHPDEDYLKDLEVGANYSIMVNTSNFWDNLDTPADISRGTYGFGFWDLINRWLFNNSNQLDFNESLLNSTIDNKITSSEFHYTDHFDQELNTSDDVSFNSLNVTGGDLDIRDNSINTDGNVTIGTEGGNSNYQICIGEGASCDYVSILSGAKGENIAIGRRASTDNTHSVALGAWANAGGYRSTCIGAYCETNLSAVAVGYNAYAHENSIGIGKDAEASYVGVVSLGQDSYVHGQRSAAIGYEAHTTGGAKDSVAIGYRAWVENKSNDFFGGTAVGTQSYVEDGYSVALGYKAEVHNSRGTAIGYKAISNATGAITICNNCYNDKPNTIKIGNGTIYMRYDEGIINATEYCFQEGTCFNETNVSGWSGGDSFVYDSHFDQELNTSDEVTFSTITATNLSDGNLVMTGGVISGAIAIGGATQLDFRIGGNPQFYLNDGNIIPQVDNNIDLGDSTHEFKDAYFDGVVYTDSVYSPTGGTAIDFAIGGADQISLTDGALTPITDNDIALGNGTHGFSDLFLGNTARIYSSGGTIMAGITVT